MTVYSFEDSEGTYWHVPQEKLWDWLKAERRHNDAEARKERQFGLTELQLQERRKGKPEPRRIINRASRRARQRQLRRIA